MTTERAAQLRTVVKGCAWWFAAQGVFLLLVGDRMASWLELRWMPSMAPYLRFNGLSLLALALFIHRGVDQPRRQYLAVDTLLLVMLGRVLLVLNERSHGFVTGVEWAGAAVDLGLAVALLLLRTRSKDMHQAGALLVMDASVLVRQTGSWIAGVGPRPQAGLGPLDPDEAPPAPAPTEVRWADGSAPLMPAAYANTPPPPPPPPGAAPTPAPAAPKPFALAPEDLERLPLDPEPVRRAAPAVPPPPAAPATAAPLPPPSPGQAKPRSEAVPRLD